jgi:hypothetical protein
MPANRKTKSAPQEGTMPSLEKQSQFKITSGSTTAPLYAVITTEDGAWASISTDASVHIHWASGKTTNILPTKTSTATVEEHLTKLPQIFAEMVPTVHIVPDDLADDMEDVEAWFKSIGLECVTHQVQ